MTLSKEELERYKRHIILPGLGIKGQQKLKEASVLIVGTGGLGSPLAMYLAASGVGKLGLVDFDVVDISNLQRQIIHKNINIGVAKTQSAAKTLKEINPHVKVELFNEPITADNSQSIINNFDIVADCTDNFETRYLINNACVNSGKPNVFGSIHQFEGQVSIFGANDGPCYRCLYPEPPEADSIPTCAEAGVMGVLPGVIGSIQATEVIKLITGIGKPLIGRLLNYDALNMQFNEVKFIKDPDCPCCGNNKRNIDMKDNHDLCNTTEYNAIEVNDEISAQELKEFLNNTAAPLLIDVREPMELSLGMLPNAINIPMTDIAERLDEIPKNKHVVVYCTNGMRSLYILNFLKSSGYNNVSNLSGGLEEWNKVDV